MVLLVRLLSLPCHLRCLQDELSSSCTGKFFVYIVFVLPTSGNIFFSIRSKQEGLDSQIFRDSLGIFGHLGRANERISSTVPYRDIAVKRLATLQLRQRA